MSTKNSNARRTSTSAAVPPGPRAKIVDVAREAGVSITTVSHALNGRGQVDPKTREHVARVARKLGYRPNRHAQQLRRTSAQVIALVSSMPFSVAGGPARLGFMMEIAAVAASVALERGLALVLVPPSQAAASAIEGVDVDAALVLEPARDDPQLEQLVQRGIPIVTIGRQPDETRNLPCIDLRSHETTMLLLEHLRAQGARHIGLLGGSQQRSPYTESASAYAEFAKTHRMRPITAVADELLGEEGGRIAAREMLRQEPQLDAICAPVDAFAVGAVLAARETRRTVPGDLMIATRYDGRRARECQPPLTALDLHLEVVATQAIKLLLEHLRGDSTRKTLRAPAASLVVRESSASAPAAR